MKKYIFRIGFLFLTLILFTRCEDYFETSTDDTLSSGDYITSVDELYAGFRGVASKLQDVADKAVFIEGLRGDLLEPTSNAPQELWDIYNLKEDTTSNSITNPKGFYNIIINANDFMINAFKFKNKYPTAIDDVDFNALISGAIRYKCWSYLMLAKIYGKAVYFDDALTEYTDLSKYPTLEFDELIQKLLTLMNSGYNGVLGTLSLDLETMFNSTDLTWNLICPPSAPLLAELNLYAGNYQNVIDIILPFLYDNGSLKYKCSLQFGPGEWYKFFTYDPINTTKEVITVVPYSYNKSQTNDLNQYFSNTFSYKYYLKPTSVAIERFENDGEKYRKKYTYEASGNDTIINKFLYTGDDKTTSAIMDDKDIILYRARDCYFFLAEAFNHLNYFPEAEAILDGFVNYYSNIQSYTNSRNPYLATYNYYYAFGSSTKGSDKINVGIRGIFGLKSITSKYSVSSTGVYSDTLNTYSDTLAYQKKFDEALIEETCLESAAEARSYFTMVRLAKYWNDPTLISDKVAAKYSTTSQQEAVKTYLSDKSNWFVKYDLNK
jgi:starch-binding outer membrane protein, SusD/RagB family